MAKKYASLSTLSTFLDNLKTLFATKTDLTTEINKKADSTHTHDDRYYTESEIDTKLASKSDTTHNHDDVYDKSGTATSTVSTHNTSTSAHNDIRLLITDLTTKLNNFLDVDDATSDQLSEVLQLIENNKGTLESLTTSKVNVSDIVDNLTTSSTSKVLSANQGVAIKSLIDVLQAELDSHTHTVANITDLAVTVTELNHLDGVASNVQAQLDSKANSIHTHSWDDLNDRPFYTKDPEEVALLNNTSITIGSDLYAEVPNLVALEKGKTYIITFNGTRYECIAWYSTHLKAVVVGNGDIIGETGQGGEEPFAIDSYAGNGCYLNASTSGTYTISISTIVSEVVQLERKYIADYIDTLTGEKVEDKVYIIDSESVIAKQGAEVFNDYDNNIASGQYSHAEGMYTQATGMISHAEGYGTKASGGYSHAEGSETTASGYYSHAEGNYTNATGDQSHAEGHGTTASGYYSHAEGGSTTASGNSSHAEGNGAIASGENSHAEGESTIASSLNQHVQGKYNIEDTTDTYAHIVGNGTNSSKRSNAHTIDWDGNGWFAGDVYVGGTSMNDTSASRVCTEADHEWTLIYDSGEIPDIVNSISGIDVSGYTNFEILVRCYNDGDSHTTRTGSAIFTAQNGKSYQFPVWTNMFTKSISTASVMAQFKLIDGWLVCPYASKLTGDIDIFDSTEGGTAGNLTSTGSGMMKCTSPLSTLTISNLDQNSDYYFGMGSRVMVWGWKA